MATNPQRNAETPRSSEAMKCAMDVAIRAGKRSNGMQLVRAAYMAGPRRKQLGYGRDSRQRVRLTPRPLTFWIDSTGPVGFCSVVMDGRGYNRGAIALPQKPVRGPNKKQSGKTRAMNACV